MADSTTDNRREENSTVYGTAIKLSIRLNHHLFDTPYHATALHMPEAIMLPPTGVIMTRPKI